MMWYSNVPCEPKYIQISYNALKAFCDNCSTKDYHFEDFRTLIYDHHCQPATKDGMFVIEQFFHGKVLQIVADYLKAMGYIIKDDYLDLEGECIVDGYDGVLMNWTW